MPSTVGTLLTLAFLVGACVALGYALVPPLFAQLAQFLESVPRLLARVQEQVGPRSSGGGPGGQPERDRPARLGDLRPAYDPLSLTEGALVSLGELVVVQQIEGNLLVPLIMRRALELLPAVIALGVLFVGWTISPLAVLVAVPILAAARVLVRDLWTERLDPPEGERARDGRPSPRKAREGTLDRYRRGESER